MSEEFRAKMRAMEIEAVEAMEDGRYAYSEEIYAEISRAIEAERVAEEGE